MPSKRTADAAEKLTEFATQRAAPAFTAPGRGLPAQRSRRDAGKTPAAGKVMGSRLAFTNLRITEAQREALRDEALARMKSGAMTRYDYSAVLRDVLDFWLAHSEQVSDWIASTYTSSQRRK